MSRGAGRSVRPCWPKRRFGAVGSFRERKLRLPPRKGASSRLRTPHESPAATPGGESRFVPGAEAAASAEERRKLSLAHSTGELRYTPRKLVTVDAMYLPQVSGWKTSEEDMKQEWVQWHSFAAIDARWRSASGENQSLPKS